MTKKEYIERINSIEEVMVEIESASKIKYCHIQESDEGGYDYTYFDENCYEIDGGNYEVFGKDYLMGEALDNLLDTETDGEYVIVRILSEEEMEHVLDAEYDDMFDDEEE